MTVYTRRHALGLAGAATLAFLAACSESAKPVSGGDEPKGPGVDLAANDPTAAAYQAGGTEIALALLAAASKASKGNAVISPLSISQAMAMSAQGAAGATLEQLATAYGCATAEDLRAGANAEITAIGKLKKTTFDLANTSFVSDNLKVKKPYADAVAKYFGVTPYAADFGDPSAATDQINGWVADRTNDKIPKLLDEGQVDADTRMVLVNALYLKAMWAAQFDPDDSEDAKFTTGEGKKSYARYMRDRRDAIVAVDGEAIAFALPYEDDDLEAVFLLPPEGVAPIEAAEGGALAGMIEAMKQREAKLSIPSFEIRQRIELSDAFKGAGVVDAFDVNKADFSALSDESTYISFVQHEAWLKVGEKGTEGAAATANGQEAGSAPPAEGPIEIYLDRPFLFAVRIRSTNSLAFVAVVNDPMAN